MGGCIKDGLDDAVEVFADLRVPETFDLKALGVQPVGAGLVCGAVMLASVDLDDQLLAEFYEIDDELADWGLTAKMEGRGAGDLA